ncbi:pyridoxamine 5'-phosphate oxidase family protein [Pseudanabaena sp. FACHB-2040]|uniref:pyridoxamine 5'-phosphate oxidase family protein n=1 Tax=Pseudanabaena sp. FACHB-2040 TaxID=2692859 RepID=UPI001686F2E2|nr:pyridoxamine 5'-phosphate oxidase family protein [Pseudanabaena sp. FACHB-2040]MBD2256510.1 pyridoxamine 5'-phosphate oxidase family protein [Pseudanabaena sp. FACHB-2040]
MSAAVHSTEEIEKLRDLVKDIDYCMLTTVDEGCLRSRPMSINGHIEANGDLWFFTYASSHKVIEVDQQDQVNVSFSDPSQQRYVSMSGKAEIVRDRSKMQDLWKPELKAWFPQELDEPDIALLKINVSQAEYWDAPAGWVAKTVGFAKALATGEKAQSGENAKINLQ